MSFSMKPSIPQQSESNITEDQWKAWEEYQNSLLGVDEEPVTGKSGVYQRSKSAVGILNFIMDMGYQPQSDGQYDTKVAIPTGDEEYSPEEIEYKQKYPNADFIWVQENGHRKRKQTSPNNPQQEYAFFFDFPEIMVDWTKHPDERMHKLGQKPLRVSYNGRFGKTGSLVFQRTLNFSPDRKTKTLSSKNAIAKIADKLGVSKAFEQSGYDFGVLAGKACKWTLIRERRVSGDKQFINWSIKDPVKVEEINVAGTKITVEQQIPKTDVGFVGVHFDAPADSYTEDTLEYVQTRKELLEVVSRAKAFKPSPEKYPDFVLGKDFKDSGLAIALANKAPTEAPEEQDHGDENQQSQSPVGFDGFDDDIPF